MKAQLFLPVFLLLIAGSAHLVNAQDLYVASKDVAESFEQLRSERDTVEILQVSYQAIQKLESIIGKWADEGTMHLGEENRPVKLQSECSWALGKTSVICVKRQNEGVYYFDQYLYDNDEKKYSVCRHTLMGSGYCRDLSIDGDKWIMGMHAYDEGGLLVNYSIREFNNADSYTFKSYFGGGGNAPTLRFDMSGKRVD